MAFFVLFLFWKFEWPAPLLLCFGSLLSKTKALEHKHLDTRSDNPQRLLRDHQRAVPTGWVLWVEG